MRKGDGMSLSSKERNGMHMKKQYETPEIEVVKFRYSDQVVAASGGGGELSCVSYMVWEHDSCKDAYMTHINRQ
jgi:hypothetical protein